MVRMKTIGWRIQVEVIATAYAVILLMGVYWFHQRTLQELSDPQAAMASRGMYAFDDEIFTVFLCLLCLVPTFFLLRLMRTNPVVYGTYARIVLALSVTAPVCAAALALHVAEGNDWIEGFCVMRLWRSPLIFIAMVMSRLVARERSAKRLINYAMLIEVLTLAIAIAMAFVNDKPHG